MTIHLVQSGNINTIQTGTTASNSAADLRITNIGSGTNYMTITTAGNIGIGTTAPSTTLDVIGNIKISSYQVSSQSGNNLYSGSFQQAETRPEAPSYLFWKTSYLQQINDSFFRLTDQQVLSGDFNQRHFENLEFFNGSAFLKLIFVCSGFNTSSLAQTVEFKIKKADLSEKVLFSVQIPARTLEEDPAGLPGDPPMEVPGTISFNFTTDVLNVSSGDKFFWSKNTNDDVRVYFTELSYQFFDSISRLQTSSSGGLIASFNSNTVGSIITTGGNVGIGMTSPSEKLDVSGGLRITSGGLMATFNSNTVGSIITTGGNVGLGTTSPVIKLDILNSGNGIRIKNAGGGTTSTYMGFSNSAESSLFYVGLDGVGYGGIETNAGLIATWTNNPIIFGTNTTERMRINTSGNVGIGTTSPANKLHVRTTSNNFVRIETDSNLAGEVSGIEFGIPAFASSTRSKITSTTFAADGSDLKFHTGSGTTAGSVRMTIGTSGNVGIGTSSPNCRLHITSSGLSNDIPSTGTGNSTKFSFMEGYDGTNGYGLIGGVLASTGTAWLQSKYNATSSTLPMSLQPLGGNLLVGTSAHTYFTGNRLTVRSDCTDAQTSQILIQGTTDARKTTQIGYDTTNNYAFIDSLNHEVAWTNTIFCRNGGNVGIATTSPSLKLHVRNTSGVGQPVASGTTQTYGIQRIQSSGDNVVLDIGSHGGNGNWFQSTLATDLSQTFPILLNPRGGNVGIGTSSPGHRLDILDSASTTSYPILIRALAPNLSNPYNVTILLGRSANCYDSSQISHDNYFGAGDSRNFGSLSYTCYGTVAMWNGQGRFGIGTVTPGYRLDVQGGDINASGSVRSNGSALTSDMRVKENIVDADTSVNLQHILALKVRHYDYTPNFLEHTGRQDESNYGFIAQEVKEIIPNAVDILPNNLMRAVVEEIPEMNEDGTPKIDEDGNPVLRINRRNEIIEEISDFHFLKKELIFTEAVGAIQELYKLYSDLKQEFEDYKTTHP